MLQGGGGGVVMFALVCDVCSFVLLIRYAQPAEARASFGIFSVLFILGSLCAVLLWSLLDGFGRDTVVDSVLSPQRNFTAEVIDSDQGALGGGLYVYVRNEKKVIDLYVCRFSKTPLRIYAGKWGEGKRIQIAWRDDNTLEINGKEYDISRK